MDLIDLENIAKRENIEILNCKMNKTQSRIINYGNSYIFMDYSKIDTSTEEKCLLAEELGHYFYDAYYTLYSDNSFIERQEYRASKWQFKALVSAKELATLAKKGYRYISEFAEELGVTEEIVSRAYTYYKENNLIDIDKT